MGAVAVGIAQGKILMDTATYYDFFSGSDRLISLIGVGIGTFLTTQVFPLLTFVPFKLLTMFSAHLMIGCAQVRITDHVGTRRRADTACRLGFSLITLTPTSTLSTERKLSSAVYQIILDATSISPCLPTTVTEPTRYVVFEVHDPAAITR